MDGVDLFDHIRVHAMSLEEKYDSIKLEEHLNILVNDDSLGVRLRATKARKEKVGRMHERLQKCSQGKLIELSSDDDFAVRTAAKAQLEKLKRVLLDF